MLRISSFQTGGEMEIRIDILPEGNTTLREITDLSQTLRSSVERMPEVDSVRGLPDTAPDQAKGTSKGPLATVSSFLTGLPAGAISAVFQLIKTIVSRPGQPPVKIKITAHSTEVSFDPRCISPESLAELAARLTGRARPGVAPRRQRPKRQGA